MNIKSHSEAPRVRRALTTLTAGAASAAIALSVTTIGASPAIADEALAPSMNIALVGDIDSLNPFVGTLSDATNIHRIQYEPLVAWGPDDNAPYPAIAESWETLDDGLTWTFHLEEGAKWSDGEDITSADVVWTFDAILENDSLGSAFGAYASTVKKIDAPDDYTVQLTLKSEQASNPGTDIPIVPEHIWSALDDPAGHANDADVVGSGPFQVTSYSATRGVTMKSNPNYRGSEAAFKQINWVPYKNADAAVQALQAGEIDMLSDLTDAQVEAMESIDKVTVVAAAGRGFRGLQINPGATDIDGNPMGDGNPVLHDKKFRQALVHAIDRATLTDRVLMGNGIEGSGIIPPLYPNYYIEPRDKDLLNFDLDLANKMLDEAGYERNSDGKRIDLDGNPISLRLNSYEHPSAQETLDFLGGWFDEIGIDTTLAVTSLAQYNDDTVMGTYDLYVSGWTVRPDPGYLFAMNQCSSRPASDGSGATSLANYCDPAYDALFAKQSKEADADKRAKLIRELQVEIDQAAVFPVIFYADTFQAYRNDRLANIEQQPTDVGSILFQNGAWSLHSATPAGAEGGNTADSPADSGSMTPWILGGVGVLLVLTVGGVLVARRNRSNSGDHE